MGTLLDVKDLKKYFPVRRGLRFAKPINWIKAVDGNSFSINEGHTFGLVGESGCGKTTTAKVILLIEEPTEGSVLFRGKEISKLKGKDSSQFRASVQAVFQDPYASLNPRMRVGSIISEPLVANSKLSRKEIKERVEGVLGKVGLNPDTAKLYPHEFSGGQRQRIALARSLIVSPRLIVLDEPVSALDVSIQGQILNLFKDIQVELGLAFLLIAHNLATVRYMSHRIGVMYLGKIVELGPVDQVYGKCFHPYTQALFSAALPSHPDLQRDEIVLPGEVPSALDPPPGCRFHPRCPSVIPICSEIAPDLNEVGFGHYVACHLYK